MPRFVLLRLRAHRLLLGAALLSIVLTTCTVAALAAFGASVGDAGLRRALQDPSSGRTVVEVTTDAKQDGRPGTDDTVRKTVVGAFGGLPVKVATSTRSGPYGLPESLRPAGSPHSDDPDLTVLATLDPSRVTVVGGALPGPPPGEGPVPVALPESAAAALKLRPGDEVMLADRLGGGTLKVRLTGTYRPTDPESSYWRLDPLGGRGTQTLSFTTYGPMLVDPAAFAPGHVRAAEKVWQGRADFAAVTAGGMDALGKNVRQATARLGHLSPDGDVVATSELPDLLDELHRTLFVTRSTLLVVALQLGLLAGLALFLVSGLLAAERSVETAWLRARGGSRGRIVGLAATEALLLAVPAAVAAPLLADPLVHLLAAHGALARAGVALEAPVATVWWSALLTALVCACIVLAPALRRPGTYAGEQTAAGGRRAALPGVAKAGADIGLLAVAVLAYWQLSRRGGGSGVLTVDGGGALGVDPILVVAPALCLLAGAVLTLRLLPLVARLGERRAARVRGLGAALTGWQLSRRAGRGTTPALLLVFAMSIGIFAIGENASWTRSQNDQADFAVGADIRVTGTSTPVFGQGAVYDDVPGVTAVTPVARSLAPLPGNREATALAVDSAAAADVMRLREDLADQPLRQLLTGLRPRHDTLARAGGFVLPEHVARLRLTMSLEALDSRDHAVTDSAVTDRITATFADRYGAPYTFVLGKLPADGRRHVLEADFATDAGRTAGAGPAGPLRLSGLKADFLVPGRAEAHRLSLTALTAVTADGATKAVSVPDGATWSARARTEAPNRGPGGPTTSAKTPHSDHRTPLTLRYDTGEIPFADSVPNGSNGATVTVRAGEPFKGDVPAVVTDAFLRAVSAQVGDRVSVEVQGVKMTARITGSVRALPTTGAATSDPGTDGGALLLDLRTVDSALADLGASGLQPGEWWLATEPGAGSRVASALRARGDITSLQVRDEQRTELRSDPLGAGPLSALPAAVVSVALLAAVGFAVAALGAMRERAQEVAILSALGAPRRSLARMAAVEQGLLVLVAVAVGAVLGGLLTRLVVPVIVLTAGADAPVPAVRVELPAASLVQVLCAVAVLPLVVVALTVLRSADSAQTLRRQGGE
ncbi:FtsX-like permease family protein [Streptomyces sp. MI02-7b]|uniref:FtsX-like permease family protein n=1 Tax=Streptomyces sp. MI02-7b TaxID=462941 RepID=UPI0029A11BB7|nr:FtsX-like permease family protein [Streptomyces sp. MI02-7b]MDX3070847.1 ABC transporter permease [Streptomyces sp. MI02-7b]